MNAKLIAVRAGLARGRIELRQTFTNAQDLWNYLFPTVILLAVMVFMRGSTVPGTTFSLGTRTLPSVLGMGVVFGGLVTVAMLLTVEREDGTLLRAKAIPHGMLGYLIGKIVLVSGMGLVGLVLQLVPGLFLFDGLAVGSPGTWLTLTWVLLLGLVATMPIGAIFGSLLSNPRNMGLIMVPLMGLIGVSGIFYPITGFPTWLQGLAQVFPIYWLGLGMMMLLPRRPGGCGDRSVLAAPGDPRRARGLGPRRADRGTDRAAPNGPPRSRVEHGRSPRQGDAARDVRGERR